MMTWKPIAGMDKMTVDHLDHNKRNNKLSNLEWVTEEENQRRAAEDHIGKEKAPKIKFIVKKNISDPDSRAVFVQEIENPETNKVYFEMSPEDTGKLTAGTYKAGCKVYFDSGLEITVWSDDILVIKGVFNA